MQLCTNRRGVSQGRAGQGRTLLCGRSCAGPWGPCGQGSGGHQARPHRRPATKPADASGDSGDWPHGLLGARLLLSPPGQRQGQSWPLSAGLPPRAPQGQQPKADPACASTGITSHCDVHKKNHWTRYRGAWKEFLRRLFPESLRFQTGEAGRGEAESGSKVGEWSRKVRTGIHS